MKYDQQRLQQPTNFAIFFFQGVLVLGNINVKLFRDNSYAIQVNWNKTVLIDHTLIKFWKLSSMVRLKKFYYLKKPN